MSEEDTIEIQHQTYVGEGYKVKARGRPKIGHTRKLSLTLTADQWQELDSIQQLDGCSVSEAIREIINVYINIDYHHHANGIGQGGGVAAPKDLPLDRNNR